MADVPWSSSDSLPTARKSLVRERGWSIALRAVIARPEWHRVTAHSAVW
jgi:hypothetical protein